MAGFFFSCPKKYMQNNSLTRKFFSTAVAARITAGVSPLSLLANEKQNASGNLSNDQGLVFLFQGDSITDGNRGRTADPNHIMGHGYAFSVASRGGADFPEAGYQ